MSEKQPLPWNEFVKRARDMESRGLTRMLSDEELNTEAEERARSKEFNDAVDRAWQNGYDAGHEEGEEGAERDAQDELDEQQREIEDLIEALERIAARALRDADHLLLAEIADIALDALPKSSRKLFEPKPIDPQEAKLFWVKTQEPRS